METSRDQGRHLNVPDADYLRWPLVPSAQAYAPINGDRLKGYVKEITAISRRYRDKGHQYWGRIAGTDADAENAKWMAAKFRAAGLTNVRIQPLDLPPQWMPQSWSVVVSGAGKSVKLEAVTPEQRLSAALSGTRDLEVVYVGWGTEADFAGRDVKGKAAFIYSMPMPGIRTTSATRNGAASRAIARGAAAVFNVVEMPGNVTGMWSITSGADRDKVPAFFVGSRDGAAVRDMIEGAGSAAPRVKIELDIKMLPGLRTANVWGELPGTTDEDIIVVAHRDGFYDGAADNASGMATQLGLAEYFAKIPAAQRRRTIRFVATSGHHSTAVGIQWLADNKDTVFAKTALLINCEHTSLTQMYGPGGQVKSNLQAAHSLYVTPGPLTPIVLDALKTFGVGTRAGISASPAGEIGRVYQFAPSMQIIEADFYYHTDAETDDVVPPSGLESTTRAYAKMIDEVNKVSLPAIRAAAPPRPSTSR